MMTIGDLLQEMEQESQGTRRLLERVPENQLGWKPHEKSMTLGQLAMHVATLPAGIARVAVLPSFDVNTRISLPDATSTAQLLATFDESLAKARSELGSKDEAWLASTWRMVDGNREVMSISRAALLRTILLNHSYHHRGQLTVFLRLLGIPLPATYGSSADENILKPATKTEE